MRANLILVLLSLTVLSCRSLLRPVRISDSVAETIFGRARASFCDGAPVLVDTTQPFFPIVALAQIERDESGSHLLSLIAEAERYENRLTREQKAQRIVLPPDERRRAVIRSEETEKIAGCYVEISSIIDNPYRPGESGAFVRVFRGGAVGRSGSVAFWLGVGGDGSVARFVRLPLFIN